MTKEDTSECSLFSSGIDEVEDTLFVTVIKYVGDKQPGMILETTMEYGEVIPLLTKLLKECKKAYKQE